MESVIQKERECWVCGTTVGLHRHHCIYGTSGRKISEKYGFTVYLCREHHEGMTGVHMNPNKGVDLALKQLCQRYFENNIGSHDLFISKFGKSYL